MRRPKFVREKGQRYCRDCTKYRKCEHKNNSDYWHPTPFPFCGYKKSKGVTNG